MTNSGTEAVDLDGVTVGGTDAGHFQRLTGPGQRLHRQRRRSTAGQTCKLRVRFDPTADRREGGDRDGRLERRATSPSTSRAPAPRPSSPAPGVAGLRRRATSTTARPRRSSPTVTNSGTEPVSIERPRRRRGDIRAPHRRRARTARHHDARGGRDLHGCARASIPRRPAPGRARSPSTRTRPTSRSTSPAPARSSRWPRHPTSLAFGDREVDDGPSAAQTSTLTNNGTEPIDLDRSRARRRDPRRLRAADRRRRRLPGATVLEDGETCDVRVRFDPTARRRRGGDGGRRLERRRR